MSANLTPAQIEQLATSVAGSVVPVGRGYWEFSVRTLAQFAKDLFAAAGPVAVPPRACNQNCNQGRNCDCGPGVGPKVDPAAWLSATQAVMPDGSVRIRAHPAPRPAVYDPFAGSSNPIGILNMQLTDKIAEQSAEIARLRAALALTNHVNVAVEMVPMPHEAEWLTPTQAVLPDGSMYTRCNIDIPPTPHC